LRASVEALKVPAHGFANPAFAAMQAVEAGYSVYGVVDAYGALEVTVRENAVARMRDHGTAPINWTTVAAELQRDWRLPTGQELGRVYSAISRQLNHTACSAPQR
jgi:hypothetical protein